MTATTDELHASIVEQELVLSGQIEGKGNIRILGKVYGKLSLTGDCHVEETGHVDGDIEADNVVLAGRLTGNLVARGCVRVLSTGRVEGDIRVPTIQISDGASINGHVHVGDL